MLQGRCIRAQGDFRWHNNRLWAARAAFWALLVLLLAALLFWCDTARAASACPTQSLTVASASSVSIDLTYCTSGGYTAVVQQPSHGSLPGVDPNSGIGQPTLTYLNNGDGNTSDTFTIGDELNFPIIFNVTISLPTSPLTVSPAALSNASIGNAYSQLITTTGGIGPYTYTTNTSNLPPGITLSSAGLLAGTPTGGNKTYTLPVTVTDSTTPTAVTYTKTYSLTIPYATIATTPADGGSLPSGMVTQAYSQQLVGSGGTAPYTYSLDSQSAPWPTGMSMNSSGLISGTPSVAGTSAMIILVTDSSANAGPFNLLSHLSLVIAPLPAKPTPSNSTTSVNYNSTGNNVALTYSAGGDAATAVTIATQAAHGVATASGTSISYTPTTNYTGSDTFTYNASNLGGTSVTPATVTVTVGAPATMTLAPTSLTLSATAGSVFTQTFTAGGGSGTYSYALTGTVPTGLNFNNSTGVLTGTPTVNGTFSAIVTATDTSTGTGAPFTAAHTYTLTVSAPTITLTPGTAPAWQRNVAGSSQQVTASGGIGSTYTYTASVLPTGLSIASATGLINGTPTTAGSYSTTITATDAYNFSGSLTYTITIGAGAPSVSSSTASASYNSGGSSSAITITTGDGTPTTLTPGTPAHGSVSANGVTGFIYTPTIGYSGPDSFTYTASNSVGSSGTATVSVTVAAPTFSMTPVSTTLTNATAGTSYSQTFTFSGGISPYTFAAVTGLPTGLSVTATTATSLTISGTPTQAGSTSFTVKMTADSSTGNTLTYPATTYTLQVLAPTLGVAPTTLTQPQVGNAYSQTLTTTGGASPYTYTVSLSALPTGLNLVGDTISGTPTVAGSYSFSITSTDANNFVATQAYSGTVGAGKPVSANSSAAVNYSSSGNTITPSTSGGTPTSLTIVTTVTKGSLSISGTSFLYTPNAGYIGTDSFVYTATNAAGTSAQATITITVGSPTIVVSPSTSWSATQNASYTQVLTWSGGTAPYTFAAVTGLPSGLSVTATSANSQTISGTPTAYGSFSVVVAATDSSTPTPVAKTVTYTLTVAQGVPVAVNDSASTTANQAITIAVTGNDSGAITSIAIGTGASHGTAVVSGLSVVYTPTSNYFGSDSFTYTDTGPGGTSNAATVTLSVAALPVPTSPAQTATVQPGQAVTLHVGAAAANGPITSVTLTSTPSSGTAVVSGTDIIYTAVTGYSGNVTFTYTLSNAFGASAPVTATVSVGAVPVAVNQSATGAAASTVLVNLMTGASGGPFTGAAVGTITPANAGTAVITDAGTSGSPSYRLRFTAAAAFAGTASITYTLSNIAGISAAATVSITIAARTNAATDPQVTALVAAHTETANRFATAQLGNFSRRLEALHGSGWARSSFGLGLTPPTTAANPMLAQWDVNDVDKVVGGALDSGMRKVGWSQANRLQKADYRLAANDNKDQAALPELPGQSADQRQQLSLWIAGTVDFGHANASGQQEGFRFTTNGVSMGADYRVSDKLSLGVGTGYSRDHSDIGDNGSKSLALGVVATVYGSLRPTPNIFIDAMFGYGMLSFDSTRYVTDDATFATGQRSGSQMFVSLSGGYEIRGENLLWSPYAKVDLASTTLNQYSETAAASDGLTYFKQRSRVSSGTLGMRLEAQFLSSAGTWTPRTRVEYRRQFSGAQQAGVSYTDVSASSPTYLISSSGSFTGAWTAGLGLKLLLSSGISLIVDYSSNLNVGQGRYQSVLLGVNVPLK